jgi:diguanylate cyclase (GGDEF)-like protein
MESIIKHLMEITGHRDHDLLNISVISALSELTNAGRARVLDILHVGEKTFVKPQITIVKGKLAPSEEMSGVVSPEVPIDQFPQLAEAIGKHESVAEYLADNGDRTIWLPVWMNEKVNVCLEILNPANYTENTKEVMGGILVVYRNFQNLLDYSERDSLTGLLNRKTFDDNFSKILRTSVQKQSLIDAEKGDVEVERRHSDREKQHWLAVLDIDHFKRVNDQFGHLYGDEVLILVANLMRSSFRPTDKLFRFGGEEFVILLRSTSKEDAKMIFERFRENVARYPFPQVGTVTISIGFAHIDPFEPAVGIIGRADQALYFAKSNGRNRVCHYEDLITSGELRIEVSQDSVEFF